MKVININDLRGTDREVEGEGFTSIRPLLESDGMGFAVCKTIIPKGESHYWHYDKHLEACYCIKGKGVLTDYWEGNTYSIVPDTIYILDNHEEHEFQATSDVVLISIFNPPLKGKEVHDENGNY